MNLTQAEKQALADASKTSGTKTTFLAYNPVTTVGDPEADAISSGKIQYKRQATATLVEVIYTSAAISSGDSRWTSVQALLHMDGADAGTTFTDSSTFARTVSAATGAPTTSTTKVKYGTAAARLIASQALAIGSVADWNFMHQAGARFTWEAWVALDDFATEHCLFSTSNGSTSNNGVYAAVNVDRGFEFQIYNSSGTALTSPMIAVVGTGTFPNDTAYHHIAIQWDQTLPSNNLMIYVDGALAATATKSANAPSAGAATATMKIGGFGASGTMLGYIDELRITSAVRYMSSFTPAGPFPENT